MFSVVDSYADRAVLRLHASHVIYQAHFPGEPITPGVCIVQVIGELVGCRLRRSLTLSRIVYIKYIAPISPVKHSEIVVHFSAIDRSEAACKAKGTITAGGELMTKFSIIYV